ncbi:MAG: TspO/MBR family protein [Sphingomicrobium sp.]
MPLVLGVGMLSGQLSNSGYGNQWFDALAKPAAMPPGWAFGVAWTILYVLLGLALALLWTAERSPRRSAALKLFLAQLTLNFAWSPLFFGLHMAGAALGLIVAIAALTFAATAASAIVRPAAAWLMVPYLAWLSFATFLNYEIVRLNPGG